MAACSGIEKRGLTAWWIGPLWACQWVFPPCCCCPFFPPSLPQEVLCVVSLSSYVFILEIPDGPVWILVALCWTALGPLSTLHVLSFCSVFPRWSHCIPCYNSMHACALCLYPGMVQYSTQMWLSQGLLPWSLLLGQPQVLVFSMSYFWNTPTDCTCIVFEWDVCPNPSAVGYQLPKDSSFASQRTLSRYWVNGMVRGAPLPLPAGRCVQARHVYLHVLGGGRMGQWLASPACSGAAPHCTRIV